MCMIIGASGANLPTGSFDTSDLLLWGKVRPEMLYEEWERAIELCEWGKRWKLDGVVRMEHELCVASLLSYYWPALSLIDKFFQ